MIEIICRDGTISDDKLIEISKKFAIETGLVVNPMLPSETKAMVFWGPEDIMRAVRDAGYVPEVESLITKEDATEILDAVAVDVHKAMLDAGWDEIYCALPDLVTNILSAAGREDLIDYSLDDLENGEVEE